MANDKANSYSLLARVILENCEAAGCKDPIDIMEMMGSASLLVVKSCADYMKIPFDDMRKMYVESLAAATIKIKNPNSIAN